MLKFLSSSRLALGIVCVLIILCLAGAIIPQEGLFTASEIIGWQEENPLATSLLKPLGLFHAFHSVLFLATIALLTINTLTCTALRMYTIFRSGGARVFTGTAGLRHSGFLVLHLSLILLFAGGAITAGLSMEGSIILTEGQVFRDNHNNYYQLVEGPFRKEKHRNFSVRLESVNIEHERGYPVSMSSDLTIKDNKHDFEATAGINQPLVYKGLSFTLDKWGYSPRLKIIDRETGQLVLDSFVALKTFDENTPVRRYEDFLAIPYFMHQGKMLTVSLYPGNKKNTEPTLAVVLEDTLGNSIEQSVIRINSRAEVDNLAVSFTDLRQWVTYSVMDDPGYPYVFIALWLGVIGVFMRYIPDLASWFRRAE